MKASVDQSYRLLAARYIRGQAKQLTGQLDGARLGEEIEYVHRARVASRRLQAALEMFQDCFEAHSVKRWSKAIRRLTKGLGEARDKDVQIQYLCGVLCDLKVDACYSGIARLLVKTERRREVLQRKVNKALDRLNSGGALADMRRVTGAVLSDAKAKELGVKSPAVFAQAERHIRCKLDRMLTYRDSLADSQDCRRHHEMRIAAKRLRYTIEIAKPVYNGKLDETIVAVKSMQTLLGDLHDCDVWLENLEAFMDKERQRTLKCFGHAGPFAHLKIGIEYLQQERRRQRERVFGQLGAYWQELERAGVWEELVRVVRVRLDQGARLSAHGEPAGGAAREPANHRQTLGQSRFDVGVGSAVKPSAEEPVRSA